MQSHRDLLRHLQCDVPLWYTQRLESWGCMCHMCLTCVYTQGPLDAKALFQASGAMRTITALWRHIWGYYALLGRQVRRRGLPGAKAARRLAKGFGQQQMQCARLELLRHVLGCPQVHRPNPSDANALPQPPGVARDMAIMGTMDTAADATGGSDGIRRHGMMMFFTAHKPTNPAA